jgi:hypothetical protein
VQGDRAENTQEELETRRRRAEFLKRLKVVTEEQLDVVREKLAELQKRSNELRVTTMSKVEGKVRRQQVAAVAAPPASEARATAVWRVSALAQEFSMPYRPSRADVRAIQTALNPPTHLSCRARDVLETCSRLCLI